MADEAVGLAGDNGVSAGDGGGAPLDAPAEPTVFDLKDDSLIRVNGADKPIKYGEAFRGFQATATRAAQEAARYKAQIAQYEARERQLEAQRQAEARQRAGQGRVDALEALRQLPYLDGATAANLRETIAGEIQQRDQVLLAALTRMQQMEKVLEQLSNSHTGAAFEGKISNWVKSLGLPPEAAEAAKVFYLAHEGDDLDDQFPDMFRAHWENQQRIFEAQRQAKITAAKKQPFLPGKGGGAGPSKPLALDPRLSAMEVADQLFPLFREDADQT